MKYFHNTIWKGVTLLGLLCFLSLLKQSFLYIGLFALIDIGQCDDGLLFIIFVVSTILKFAEVTKVKITKDILPLCMCIDLVVPSALFPVFYGQFSMFQPRKQFVNLLFDDWSSSDIYRSRGGGLECGNILRRKKSPKALWRKGRDGEQVLLTIPPGGQNYHPLSNFFGLNFGVSCPN